MLAKKLAKLKEKKEGLSISFKMLSSGADPLNGAQATYHVAFSFWYL